MLRKFDEYRNDSESHRIGCVLRRPDPRKKPGTNKELEIHYLPESSMTYLIQNRKVRIPEGTVMAFWSLMPHQLIDYTRDEPYYVLTIPISIVQEWRLPDSFLDACVRGEVQLLNANQGEVDATHFKRWTHTFSQECASEETGLLEMGSFLKKFAVHCVSANQSVEKVATPSINLVERMAMFIAGNFTEPIKVSDVANEVGLHPDYTNAIFKRAFCSTISDYIMEQRVLYAQRKLSITTESITSLAFQSGFNSICRFNAAFKKRNNMTPREYRQKYLAR